MGVVSVILGGDVRDTETGSHGKVGDHGDGQNQTREPVEDSSLSLDPHGEDPDTDDTEGEQGENDPEGGVAGVGRVQEPDIRVGLG